MGNVFISYSHFDSSLLKDLKRHFAPFESSITFWDDSKIRPGDLWKEEIAKAIENCTLAILMISADFLASEFIRTNELPKLLEAAEKKGKKILSIYLKPCAIEFHKDIIKYQFLNSLSFPISSMTDTQKEELWTTTVRQVVQLLNDEATIKDKIIKEPFSRQQVDNQKPKSTRAVKAVFKQNSSSSIFKHIPPGPYDIYIDNHNVGEVDRGESIALTVAEGLHALRVTVSYFYDASDEGGSFLENKYETSDTIHQDFKHDKKYVFELGHFQNGFLGSWVFAIKLIDIL